MSSSSWKSGLQTLLRGIHQGLVQNRRRQRLASVLAELAPHQPIRVLDVGCGSGEVAQSLSELRPLAHLEGVDTLVRPRTLVPVTAYDGQHLPFEDGSFDYAMLVDVLHHTADPAGILKECRRVARHGIWIKDHLAENLFDHGCLRFMDFMGNWGHGVVLPYNYLSRTQWARLLEDLGLEASVWNERLQLYRPPLSWIFDRHLHFVASLRIGP